MGRDSRWGSRQRPRRGWPGGTGDGSGLPGLGGTGMGGAVPSAAAGAALGGRRETGGAPARLLGLNPLKAVFSGEFSHETVKTPPTGLLPGSAATRGIGRGGFGPPWGFLRRSGGVSCRGGAGPGGVSAPEFFPGRRGGGGTTDGRTRTHKLPRSGPSPPAPLGPLRWGTLSRWKDGLVGGVSVPAPHNLGGLILPRFPPLEAARGGYRGWQLLDDSLGGWWWWGGAQVIYPVFHDRTDSAQPEARVFL